jgi:transcriptional regulator with XRE-family HTH domain
VGERIVRTRQRRGWSQAELARRLEVTRERLGKWERGATSPGLEELVWLSEVLQVPVWELGLGESPEEPLSSAEMMTLARYFVAMNRLLRPWLERLRQESVAKGGK